MGADGAVPRVLLVDDDDIHREFVRRLLGASACVHEAQDGARALDALTRDRFDVLLLDNRLPDCRAVDLLAKLETRPLRVVVLSTLVTPELAAEVLRLGADACLQKDQVTCADLLARTQRNADAPMPSTGG